MASDPIKDGMRKNGYRFVDDLDEEVAHVATKDHLPNGIDIRSEMEKNGYQFSIPPSVPAQPPVDDGIFPFLKSAASAAGPELIGMDPLEGVQPYRDQNPVAGFASQAVGYTAPMLAGMGAANALKIPSLLAKVPVVGRGMAAATEMQAARPYLAQGIKDLYALAPYEGARLAGSAVAEAKGHEGAVLRTAGEVGLDLGAGLVLGSGIEVVRQARPFVSRNRFRHGGVEGRQIGTIIKEFPDYMPEELPQARHAKLGAMTIPDSIQGKQRELLEFDIAEEKLRAEREILTQLPSSRTKMITPDAPASEGIPKVEKIVETKPHVGVLEGGKRNAAWKRFSALFVPGATSSLHSTKLLKVGEKGFDTVEEMLAAKSWLDMRPGWQERVQYPRVLTVKEGSKEGAQYLRDSIREGLGDAIDGGFHLRKEVDGLYVVAQRLKTKPGKPAQWMLFKTHDPGHFYPNLQSALKVVDDASYKIKQFTSAEPERRSSRVLSYVDKHLKDSPVPGPDSVIPPASKSQISKAFEKLLPREVEALRKDLGAFLGNFGRVSKRYLAPLTHRFSGSARFTWLNNLAKDTYEASMIRAIARFEGTRLPAKSKNLLGAIFEKPEYEGGVRKILTDTHALGKEAWAQFNAARVSTMSPGRAKELGFHPGVIDAMRKLDRIDKASYNEILKINKYYGLGDETFTPEMYHRMMSHAWRGSFRARVIDKNGKTIGFGSGVTPSAAEKEAKTIIASMDDALSKSGMEPSGAKVTELINSSFDMDAKLVSSLDSAENALREQYQEAVIRVNTPKRFLEKKGMAGFAGDVEHGIAPLTLKEAIQSIQGNMIETELHATHLMAQREFAKYIADFSKIDGDALGAQMYDALNRMRGQRGDFSQNVSQALDRFLAPILGSNAAERIVRTVNRVQYGLTLGFVDIGYPIVNMTSILTQLLPEVAFVERGLPGDLARAYDYHLVRTAEGGVREVGVLSPVRLLWQALRDLRTPDEELRAVFERALTDGKIGPRFLEEAVGRNTLIISNLKEALAGKQPLVDVLLALNEFPGAKSEELARAVAFASGWRLFRKHIGLEPEEAYRAASHFVTRSMYGYAASERPLILTGPLGTMFGLFKNYSFNYIANMMQYASEGAVRGNWAPLMWQMATTGAVAGAAGTPLWLIAEGMNSVFSDKGLQENLYSLVGTDNADTGDIREAIADTFIYGFPSWAGISLQGRAQAPGSNPVHDFEMIASLMLWDRMKHFGTAVEAGMAHNQATGEHPIQSKEMRDAFTLAFAPRTIQRYQSLMEDGAIRSLRNGNKLIDPLSPFGQILYTIGLQPLEAQKAFEVDDINRDYIAKKADKVAAYGDAYVQAKQMGDSRAMLDVLHRAMARGVDINAVVRSAQTKLANEDKSRADRTGKGYDALVRKRLFGIVPNGGEE